MITFRSQPSTHLAESKLKGPEPDASGLRLLVLGFEPHGVGDHGEEEQRHAAGDALHAGEVGACGAREDGEPQVIVGQLLACGGREKMLEGDELVDASHR